MLVKFLLPFPWLILWVFLKCGENEEMNKKKLTPIKMESIVFAGSIPHT